LAQYVEHLWLVRGHLPTRWRNMILPDGAMELIINLGDPQKLCKSDNYARYTLFRHSWLSGERTKPIVIDEEGYVHLLGVRLRAGGAWPFLGLPLREFTNQVVELDSMLGREVSRLREQMDETTDDNARFALVEGWLTARMHRRSEPARAISYALNVIRRGGATVRIGQIADEVGLSHKHLLREFDRCVGLTPKIFARVCAFQKAVKWIGQKPLVDWADTAVACGYYDQAHFIHEFRAFSGLTPGAYLKLRGPYLNYLTLND
jgi:AraC-like DNA-binding protein